MKNMLLTLITEATIEKIPQFMISFTISKYTHYIAMNYRNEYVTKLYSSDTFVYSTKIFVSLYAIC